MIVVCEERYELTEAPLYIEGSFYWVDITNGAVYELPIEEAAPRKIAAYPGELVSNIAVFGQSELLVTGEHYFYRLERKYCRSTKFVETPICDKRMRCNDGSYGPDGKFYFGTMEKQPTGSTGSIYSLDRYGNLENLNIPIGIPNSFIWLNDGSLLISDSHQKKTFKVTLTAEGVLDWDCRKVWLDLTGTKMTPDGGALDGEGNIWIAMWGGGVLHKYSITGTLIDRLLVPAKQPTSCAFGGENKTLMLVTTAAEGLSEQDLCEYPDSGRVLLYELSGGDDLVRKWV